MRALSVLLLSAALGACGHDGAPSDASKSAVPQHELGDAPEIEASCAATLEFDGISYQAVASDPKLGDNPARGDEIGRSELTSCGDTDEDSGPGNSVTVYEIEGVDPDIGVLTSGPFGPLIALP